MGQDSEFEAALRQLLLTEKLRNQGEIAAALAARGIPAKQPTISRALQRLNAGKVLDHNGEVVYRIRLADMALPKQVVEAVSHNNTLIIVITSSGAAGHVAELIDNAHLHGIAGTIAGDNTIFIAPQAGADIGGLTQQIQGLFGV